VKPTTAVLLISVAVNVLWFYAILNLKTELSICTQLLSPDITWVPL
jgi:hypothetical protein